MTLGGWNGRWVALALVLVCAPVIAAGLAIAVRADTRPTFDAPVDVVALVVSSVSATDQTPVVLRAVLEDERHVRSSLNGGIVTEVHAQSGDVIIAGTPVIQVDGVDRVAIAGVHPPWRRLSVGMHGPDVAALQALLAAKGLLELEGQSPDGDYGAGTAAAVRELSKDLGVERPSSAAELDWFLWLPSESFEVGEILVEAGENSPPSGVVVLLGEQRATVVEITASDGAPIRRDDNRPRLVILGDISYPTTTTADDVVVLTDPSEVDLTLFDENLIAPAQLLLTEPLSVVPIPASAVVHTPTGPCVVRAVGTEPARFEAARVVISGSEVNRVEVLFGLEPGDRIVVNPRVAAIDSTCS